MRAIEKKRTNIGVGLGVAAMIAGRALTESGLPSPASPGGLLLMFGMVAFIWGCCAYAEGKGYDSIVGLLGMLWIIGLLILIALPDREPEGKAAPRAASEPRPTR